MIRLTREVRLTIPAEATRLDEPVRNSWVPWPNPAFRDAAMAIRVTLAGDIDSRSGYLCNIKRIDNAVREPLLRELVNSDLDGGYPTLLHIAWDGIQNAFEGEFRLETLSIHPSPWFYWSSKSDLYPMPLFTQQFEFSAAHRLHNPELDEVANKELFGKCNNPFGHGHNYVVEVTVRAHDSSPESDVDEAAPALEHVLQQAVREAVIEPLDHKNLDIEVEAFQKRNSTVENIAVVIWEWLVPTGIGHRLENVRVYETPKTWADYRGGT